MSYSTKTAEEMTVRDFIYCVDDTDKSKWPLINKVLKIFVDHPGNICFEVKSPIEPTKDVIIRFRPAQTEAKEVFGGHNFIYTTSKQEYLRAVIPFQEKRKNDFKDQYESALSHLKELQKELEATKE